MIRPDFPLGKRSTPSVYSVIEVTDGVLLLMDLAAPLDVAIPFCSHVQKARLVDQKG